MAHFAKLSQDNVVLEVNSVNNEELLVSKTCIEENGNIVVTLIESEEKGIAFLTSWSGGHTNWRQTSYNGKFRGKYAGIGDVYDAEANIFRSSIEDVSPSSPVIESVVETQQTVDIPALTTTDIQTISSVDISALNTSDLQSLTTTGL